MENLIIYIAKASLLLALFLLAYNWFLKKETFFTTNRWYLLAGLLTSVVLPFISYTKIIWVDPTPATAYDSIDLQQLVMWQQAQTSAEPEFTINWLDVLGGMYFAGVLFFLVRFVIDLYSLRRLIRNRPIVKQGDFLMVDSPDIKSPFSFFNYIVYNSAILGEEELQSIICHEKVHSRQNHSVDMILSQWFCVIFWINPFAWIYKKAISQNLEFIADAEATKLIADKEAYQKTLLKITVQPECIAITNHFYQSLIKKRIVMLNKQQSKKISSWKYGIVLPALAAFMLAFQVQTVAQERTSEKSQQLTVQTKSKISIEVTKDSRDEELQADKKMIKEEFGADVNFENIKRNQNKEITAIKVTVTDAGQSQHYEVSGNNPISPFTIEVQKDNTGRNSVSFGTGAGDARIMANAFVIRDGDDNNTIILENKRSFRMERPEMGRFAPEPPMPPAGRGFGSANVNIDSDDMLVAIDGVKKGRGEAAMKQLNANDIASITIHKGKEGKKKYGKDAKKGVIEITTRKPGDRLMMSPRAYRIEVPEMGEHLQFNFDMPDMPDMESFNFDFGNLEDFNGAFLDGEFISSEELTPEERQKITEEMQKVREEFQKKFSSIDYNKAWEGVHERIQKNKEASSEELEQARKEMEQAKKELEQARKELEQARKNFNKKA